MTGRRKPNGNGGVAGRRARRNEYSAVADRIRAFYARHPDGSIQTELVRLEGDLAVFRALVYRGPEDPHPTTGWAHALDVPGGTRARKVGRSEAGARAPTATEPTGRTNFVEQCETCAVGRALANLNFAGGRRPSREEMEKVARMRAAGAGGRRVRRPAGVDRSGAPLPDPAPGADDRAPRTPTAESAEIPEPVADAATRIRELLRAAPLAPAKRERIETLLAKEPEDAELREIEAYLLALRPRRRGRRRRSADR